MKIVYGKTLSHNEISIVEEVSKKCGILFETAKLLFYRGIKTIKDAKEFLSHGKNVVYNPFLLSNMKEAQQRIILAKENAEKVLIFGDYDADGICATTVLFNCLKEFGINALVEIPERDDGYGLSFEKIEQIYKNNKIDLLITVDCGISEYENIEKIKNLGIDVIVTDHHQPPEQLPNCLTINPKISGQEYPFDGLCGAGVAYKLGCALIGEDADKYLDYVAVATVADSMDLIGENRKIVYEGLKLFNNGKIRSSFAHLLGDKTNQITVQNLAFIIAPRINAGGRMGDAHSALKLFMSENPSEIFKLAVLLNQYNISRQTECDIIYREAKEIIDKENLWLDEVIVIASDKWKTGFIGIVAAKLVEEYNRPVIVFAKTATCYKGSARSVNDINIYNAISFANDIILGFGGHSQAAGVSVEYDNIALFRKRLCEYVKTKYDNIYLEKSIYVDWNIEKPFTLEFAKEIELLEPFGVGNKKPVFSFNVKKVCPKPLKLGSPHYTFMSNIIEILDFNGQEHVQILTNNLSKKIVFEPNVSCFRNKYSLKGFLKNIVYNFNDFNQFKLDIFRCELLKIIDNNLDYDIIEKKPQINLGYGTIYTLSNLKNLKEYSFANIPQYLFNLQDKGSANCLIISLTDVPQGYNKIIYLDKPTAVVNSKNNKIKIEIFNNLDGQIEFSKISCDREHFVDVFNMLNDSVGIEFENSASFCKNYNINNPEQFIFCCEVFFELNIFHNRNGLLNRNKEVSNSLSNSKIYNKALTINGGL